MKQSLHSILALTFFGALAASSAHAVQSAHMTRTIAMPTAPCAPLSGASFSQEMVEGAGMLEVLRHAVTPHGWTLQSNAPDGWGGPVIRARFVEQNVADALRTMIDFSRQSGWQVQAVADRNACTVNVRFSPSQIATTVIARPLDPTAPTHPAPAEGNAPTVSAGGAGDGDVVTTAATAPTPSEPTPPAPPAPPAPVILAAGQTLSVALTQFVASQGWTLQWGLDYDHFIEADIPLPTGDWQSAVRFLVEAYQAQGGLIGVAPRFATTNRIVYFTKADHAR